MKGDRFRKAETPLDKYMRLERQATTEAAVGNEEAAEVYRVLMDYLWRELSLEDKNFLNGRGSLEVTNGTKPFQ